MPEPDETRRKQSSPADSAAAGGSLPVTPIVSHRVRELPPPPKAEEAPSAFAVEYSHTRAACATAAQATPSHASRVRDAIAAVPLEWWKTAFWTVSLALLVLMVGFGIWRQSAPREDQAPPAPGNSPKPHAKPATDDSDRPAARSVDLDAAPAGLPPDASPLVDLGLRLADGSGPPAAGVGPPRFGAGLPTAPASGTVRRGSPDPAASGRGQETSPQPKPQQGPAPTRPSGAPPASGPDWLLQADTRVDGKLDSRKPGGRSAGIRYGGGSPQSEEAVERGLRWLMAHQRDDGSWRFNHITEACQHYCTHPGTEASTTAATGLALLPFLGASYTHKQGEYQEVVQRGLDYLLRRAMLLSYGADLRDGSAYGQALATIALCEAYGLTRDPLLKDTAQNALNFIVYCQDRTGGGWRYVPGAPGDTTVTGWMLMALKSGQMAKLEVPTPAIFLAERFLASVQNEDGSQYGYMTRKPGQTTTAVGLLCRMYTGWRRDNPGLQKGIAQLARWGMSETNLYYDYYATQAIFHWSGPEWEPWNRKMRDNLITRQNQGGHESGSWYFSDKYGDQGGRLYNTALAIMILEVYYRYMPLYGEKAFGEF